MALVVVFVQMVVGNAKSEVVGLRFAITGVGFSAIRGELSP